MSGWKGECLGVWTVTQGSSTPSNCGVKVSPCTHTETHTDCHGRQYTHLSALARAWLIAWRQTNTHNGRRTHSSGPVCSLLKCRLTRTHTHTHTIFLLDLFQHQGTAWLCKLCLWLFSLAVMKIIQRMFMILLFAFTLLLTYVDPCAEVCRGFLFFEF